MPIKYLARYGYRPEIVVVEVTRETDGCVILPNGRRAKKETSYESYFNTFDDAKAYLESRVESEVQSAKVQLNFALGKQGNIKGLKPLGTPSPLP